MILAVAILWLLSIFVGGWLHLGGLLIASSIRPCPCSKDILIFICLECRIPSLCILIGAHLMQSSTTKWTLNSCSSGCRCTGVL